MYVDDTTRNGWTTVREDFWALDEADANNSLYVGDTSGYSHGCYTILRESRLRDYFDPTIFGCPRDNFTVEVNNSKKKYVLRGNTGKVCKHGYLICP